MRQDGTFALRWRGLGDRTAVVVRVVLVDRRGRVVARGPARVVRRPADPPPPPRPPRIRPTADPTAPPTRTRPRPRPRCRLWPGFTPGGPLVLAADAQRLHSLGADRWDVWTCGDVGGATAQDAAAVLDARIVPYFAWLSGGRYRPEFRARGALDGSDPADCAPEAGSSAPAATAR